MSSEGRLDALARAVLYEGVALYPYRPTSLKNRKRYAPGDLFPEGYCRAAGSGERWSASAECLLVGRAESELRVRARFLQLVARSEGDSEGASWHQAVERESPALVVQLGALLGRSERVEFAFPAVEEGDGPSGTGTVARVAGYLEVSAREVVIPPEWAPKKLGSGGASGPPSRA